jgi:hypothetical protein
MRLFFIIAVRSYSVWVGMYSTYIQCVYCRYSMQQGSCLALRSGRMTSPEGSGSMQRLSPVSKREGTPYYMYVLYMYVHTVHT